MNWITHIIEPKRLLLTWKSKSPQDRMARVVAELTRHGGDADLHYLDRTQDFTEASSLGFTGYPAFSLTTTAHHHVMDIFMRRLPPSTRGDYNKYLESIRIHPGSNISSFALLGYSGAKLPDDDFVIMHPCENVSGPCELLTEIAGFHYYEGMSVLHTLTVGSPVSFQQEQNNPKDQHAIQVMSGQTKLGYINRALAPTFSTWLAQGKIKNAVIERVNGRSEKPNVYVFVNVG